MADLRCKKGFCLSPHPQLQNRFGALRFVPPFVFISPLVETRPTSRSELAALDKGARCCVEHYCVRRRYERPDDRETVRHSLGEF